MTTCPLQILPEEGFFFAQKYAIISIDIEPFSEEMNMKEITICLNEGQGAVSADIYGQFIEHLGDCVYGGVYEKMS